jgi:uncharacterized protein YdhG (YjbR/CyaY superfamily)
MQRNAASKSVEDYLKNFSGDQLITLEKIRSAIKAVAPNAEESISYGIPAYKQNGIIAYFAGFKNHCSYFPGSYGVIKLLEAELKAYKISKGTIQFPVNKPLPSSLVKKLVLAKMTENETKLKSKGAKPKL